MLAAPGASGETDGGTTAPAAQPVNQPEQKRRIAGIRHDAVHRIFRITGSDPQLIRGKIAVGNDRHRGVTNGKRQIGLGRFRLVENAAAVMGTELSLPPTAPAPVFYCS